MPKTSEVYKNLYHYTTWEGLQGILSTRTLWATHYKFLNDYSEITLFRDRLVNLMYQHVQHSYEQMIKASPQIGQKIQQEGGLAHVVQHDTEVLVDANYRVIGEEIYILSFCGEHKNSHVNKNGLLSQWRGYGAGGGFALVFNTENIEHILNLEVQSHEYSLLHLSDLVYSDDDIKLQEEFSEDLATIADDVKILFNHESPPDEKSELKGFSSFVSCISRYKHHGFCEEHEVRVVALPTEVTQEITELAKRDGVKLKPEKERKFRKKEGGLIPYIELFGSPEIDLPIERIIVGPHKEKEARAAALRVMLKGTGIEISCSDIPFVG